MSEGLVSLPLWGRGGGAIFPGVLGEEYTEGPKLSKLFFRPAPSCDCNLFQSPYLSCQMESVVAK